MDNSEAQKKKGESDVERHLNSIIRQMDFQIAKDAEEEDDNRNAGCEFILL